MPHGLSIETEKGKPEEWPAAKAVDTLRVFSRFLIPLLIVVMFPYWLAAKLVQVILFSAAGLFFNRVVDARLSYKELFNLGVHALLPPTLAALLAIKLDMPVFPFVFMAIYFVYLYAGIRAAAGLKAPG
jgi:hypothetical protein